MFLSRIQKLEIAIEYIRRAEMFEYENCSINVSEDQEMQDIEASEKEAKSLNFAVQVLSERLLELKCKPVTAR